MDILKVENVSKNFINHKALDDISLNVPQGEIYGLLGPNGAGKTTLLRIINHITAPDTGRVLFDGHQLTQADVVNIGYLPEERGLYKKMKVGEQAMFFARLKGLSKSEAKKRLTKWFEKFGIMDWWNKKVEELSKGMAQKVQFVVTVLHEPRLLIFDEPFSGFDPINAELLKNEILELRDNGATVIFSTHNMSSVEQLCDNITLINRSKNILSGNVEKIRKEFGSNRYRFEYAGETSRLLSALGDRVIEHNEEARKGNESATTSIIRFSDDVKLRDIIEIANREVELLGFSSDLPSMDEIFITTVKNSNHE